MQAEMDAEEIEDACRVMGLAGQIGLGELGPEACGVGQFAGGQVIGMGVLPVMGEQKAGLQMANPARELATCFEVRRQRTIRQAEIATPIDAENGTGRRRLALTNLWIAVRRRFAVGQIEYANLHALGLESQNGPAGADFGVVGMSSNNQVVERCGQVHDGIIPPVQPRNTNPKRKRGLASPSFPGEAWERGWRDC